MAAKNENDADAAERMFAAAARFYKQAAEMYPPDDEYFPCACFSFSPGPVPLSNRSSFRSCSSLSSGTAMTFDNLIQCSAF